MSVDTATPPIEMVCTWTYTQGL